MNNSVFRLSLNVQLITSQTYIAVRKNDTSRQIVISLTDGGKPYEITTDCAAVFSATKPDGSLLYNACKIENNTIIYEFTSQTVNNVGMMPVEIKLYGGDGKLLTSPRFTIIIEGVVYTDDSQIESSDEFSALTETMARAEAAIAIAEAYAERSMAKVGEITVYADKWEGSDKLHSQVVAVDGVTITEKSQVVIALSAEQVLRFRDKEISFVTENEGGVITVFVIGDVPQNDYVFEVIVKEVVAEEENEG